jgi:dolichol-phosphate mannosyltransferase
MAELLSVVVPVYREAGTLVELRDRIAAVVDALVPPLNLEIIFVNDGSIDDSLTVLYSLVGEDPRTALVDLSRNFGHQIAVTAGLDHASGDAAVIIDADLQDPPEVIAPMVDAWRGGADVVFGVRIQRQGETRMKRLTASLFYRLLRRLSDADIPVDSGDFRLVSRRVLEVLGEAREEGRYLRGLIAWAGFRQVPLPYARAPRGAGESGYTLRKLLRLASAGIVGFSEKPLRLALQLGAAVVLLSAALLGWIVALRIVRPNDVVPGFAALMSAILFLGGVQLLCLGVAGEYIGQIIREVRRRPLYVVRERVNLPPAATIGGRPDSPRQEPA